MLKTFWIVSCFAVLSLSICAQAASSNWMQGKWEGTGYQISDNSTWAMKLNVAGGKYSIDYPSLKCGGEWRLVSINRDTATFIERITYGKDKCEDDGNVVIELIGETQLAFRWSLPETTVVESSSILIRAGR